MTYLLNTEGGKLRMKNGRAIVLNTSAQVTALPRTVGPKTTLTTGS